MRGVPAVARSILRRAARTHSDVASRSKQQLEDSVATQYSKNARGASSSSSSSAFSSTAGGLSNGSGQGFMKSTHGRSFFFPSSGPCPHWEQAAAQRAMAMSRHLSSAAGGPLSVSVPSMGESVTDGTIAVILKEVGDSVDEDEVIAQIETDKVTIDVKSPSAGVITQLSVSVGDTVTPGSPVAVVATGEEAAEAKEAAREAASAAEEVEDEDEVEEVTSVAVNVVVPSMGESVNDGILALITKDVGDSVQVDEVIAQVETDKVTIDVKTPEEGIIESLEARQGDTVMPGTCIAVVRRSLAPLAPETLADRVTAAAEQTEAAAAPAAAFAPPPPAAAAAPPPPPPPPPTPPPPSPPPPTASPSHPSTGRPLIPHERERRVPMTRLRKRVAQRLKDSQNTFALLTTFNEVDMTNLMALRNDYKDAFLEKHGVKLGFMSAFIKAAATALQQEPNVNAVIDGDDIIYRDYIDISIAVGTPKGLVVPVIRRADELSFAAVERTVAALGRKAKEGSISIDDMAGGTFTISNGGVYGSLLSTPIINPPQSAILGMHTVQQRPLVINGSVVPRPMMYVALTYDHRLIDGREAVTFLRRVKEVVEDPRRLLLDL